MSEAAVIDGVLQHVSPSQIKTYRACPRKWYYEKVLRLATESSAAQNAGTALHKEIENYYNEGTPPSSAVCQNALAELPSRSAGFQPEVELAEPSLYINGVRVKGRIDLVGAPRGSVVEIYDFKTCSSWRYCKTEDELRSDVQQGIYAKWAQDRFPDATAFRVALVYMHRQNARVRVVAADLTREDIAGVWAGCVETVELMLQTAGAEVDDVPQNYESCSEFGGCPYFGTCRALVDKFDMVPE